MFKRVTNKKTATYNVFGSWYIDIIESDDMFEAWIYLKSYDIKSLMWGSPKQQEWGVISRKEFLNMVKANWADYANGYIDEFALDEGEVECEE